MQERCSAIFGLGHECAERGLETAEQLNAYGRELEALVAALGPDGES